MSIEQGGNNPQEAALNLAQDNFKAAVEGNPETVAGAIDPFQAEAILQKGAIQVAEWKAITKGAMLKNTLGNWVVSTGPQHQNEPVQIYSDTAWNMYIDNWNNKPPTYVSPQKRSKDLDGWISIDDTIWG